MDVILRTPDPGDDRSVNEICFLTFDQGQDERFRELSALRWSIPYLRYQRDHALVAEDSSSPGRIAGYVLSALDARGFRKQFRERMEKDIVTELTARRRDFSASAYLKLRVSMIRYPEILPRRFYKSYPAHLHINIHPDFQGMGMGNRLIDGLLDHLRTEGCPGVHLGVANGNTGAVRFYERYGFRMLYRFPAISYYGIATN